LHTSTVDKKTHENRMTRFDIRAGKYVVSVKVGPKGCNILRWTAVPSKFWPLLSFLRYSASRKTAKEYFPCYNNIIARGKCGTSTRTQNEIQ